MKKLESGSFFFSIEKWNEITKIFVFSTVFEIFLKPFLAIFQLKLDSHASCLEKSGRSKEWKKDTFKKSHFWLNFHTWEYKKQVYETFLNPLSKMANFKEIMGAWAKKKLKNFENFRVPIPKWEILENFWEQEQKKFSTISKIAESSSQNGALDLSLP